MIKYGNLDEFEDDWEELPFLLVVISDDEGEISKKLINKIQDFLMIYPEVELGFINVDEITDAASYFNTYTYPTVVFYVEGVEVFREGRNIKMVDLERSIVENHRLLHGELDG